MKDLTNKDEKEVREMDLEERIKSLESNMEDIDKEKKELEDKIKFWKILLVLVLLSNLILIIRILKLFC